jgi:HEAT repeat protein
MAGAVLAVMTMLALPFTGAGAQETVAYRSDFNSASGLPLITSYVADPADRWFPQDTVAALYRRAREQFNRADYVQAARLFRALRDGYASSQYVPQAMYYEAFALYRIAGDDNFRRALEVLQMRQDRFPDAPRGDARELAVRIEGELARQGDAEAAEELAWLAASDQERAASDQERAARDQERAARDQARVARDQERTARDQERAARGEEDDIRVAALNALLQMDAENAMPILRRVLENHDPENVNLRRKAVFLVSQKRTSEREEILLAAAREDPDLEVRMQAVYWLSQVRTDQAVEALDSILQSGTETELQERAIFALSQHRSERAGEILRDYAERQDAPIELRGNAIHWLGQHRSVRNTSYLRDLYARLDDPELKEKAMFALSQTRNRENAEFLLGIALDDTESVDVRKKALFWSGQMRIVTQELFDLYNQVTDRELKEQLIFVYSQRRRDDAAIEKLIDIVRNETDTELRRRAIFWLGQTNDPRAIAVLEEIIRN